MSGVIALMILATIATYGDAVCIDRPLQTGVDFSRLGGVWHQFRHTRGVYYDEMNCYHVDIVDIDEVAQTFQMQSKFRVAAQGIKKSMSPKTAFTGFIEFDSSANYGQRVAGKPFIGDHVATDYENYLIFYKCEDDVAVVDIEIKSGLQGLSAAVIDDIQRNVLTPVGVDYFSLAEVDQAACPYPEA